MTSTPNGFAGDLFFEEKLRQFLTYQLKAIKADTANLGSSFFEDMFGSFGDDVRLQIRKWFVETSIPVTINMPRDNIIVPFVCVIASEETEAPVAYLADYGGVMYEGGLSVTASAEQQLPNVYGDPLTQIDDRPRGTQARQVLSLPESRVTRIYVGTEDVNATMYLYKVVKALLIVNKIEFDKYAGARNMKISGNDVEYRPELAPSFAFFRMLTMNYDMNFDIPLSPTKTIGGVNVSFQSFLSSGAQ